MIAIAAVSIGAMVALQQRSATPPPKSEPAEAGTVAALPIYEEAVEPAAADHAQTEIARLPPMPAAPIDPAVREPEGPPAWQRHAVEVVGLATDPRPRIAVVIDDLGVDRERGERVMRLPGPLTVAFLPYARGLDRQVSKARQAGHELLAHLPMDPRDRAVTDPGPNALLVDLDPEELDRRIAWNLSRFDGYVGINNHMGSRFTADAAGVGAVMAALKSRGLLFLDSRTSGQSLVPTMALAYGVPSLARDVFIDHLRTPDAVRDALAEVERVARRNGRAVAIGHPRDITIDALGEWLPQLEQRGFVLVPVSALVREARVAN